MKKVIFLFFSIFCLDTAFSQQTNFSARCDYAMDRADANYFAKAKGYNGYGFMPMLDAIDFERMMTKEARYFYTNVVPICSYCQKQSVLASWRNDLAVCNAGNYYYNLINADSQRSIQIMDSYIEWMRLKRN